MPWARRVFRANKLWAHDVSVLSIYAARVRSELRVTPRTLSALTCSMPAVAGGVGAAFWRRLDGKKMISLLFELLSLRVFLSAQQAMSGISAVQALVLQADMEIYHSSR